MANYYISTVNDKRIAITADECYFDSESDCFIIESENKIVFAIPKERVEYIEKN